MNWDVRFAAWCSPLLLAALVAACDTDAVTSRADASSGSTNADVSTSTATPSNGTTGAGDDANSTAGPGSSSTGGDAATRGTSTTDKISTVTGDDTTTGVRETVGEEDSSAVTGSSTTTSGAASTTGEATDDTTTGESTEDTTTSESTDGTTTTGESSTGGDDDPCTLSEDFEGYADGSPWPPGWSAEGGVALADIEGGWGRLRPLLTDYSLGRMVRQLPCAEPDVSLTFMFTGVESQGIGLYTRHNGGYLLDTTPPGRGYSAFAESFRDPHGIGVWREVGGIEQQLGHQPATVEADVEYRMRYRVTQLDPATSLLQAKIWPVGEPEPVDWMVESTDTALSLQGAGGRMTVDAWVSEEFNGPVAPDLLIDDIVVSPAL